MDDKRFTHYYIDPYGDKVEVRIIGKYWLRFYLCEDGKGKRLIIHKNMINERSAKQQFI